MSNFLSGQILGSAPASVSVGITSTSLVSQNLERQGLVVINTSTGTIYLAMDGATATLNAGIALNPSGGTWVMDEYTFTKGQVSGIAHSASVNVAIQEFYVKN